LGERFEEVGVGLVVLVLPASDLRATRAGERTDFAGLRIASGQFHPRRHDADAGRGDEDAVALAALDDLGIAGHHRHAGGFRGCRHALHDARQIGELEPLFDDEGGR